jgi:hypothetical protein
VRAARPAGIGGRVAPPDGSTPCHPTIQMPNENRSLLVGTYLPAIKVPILPPAVPAKPTLDRATGIPVARIRNFQ